MPTKGTTQKKWTNSYNLPTLNQEETENINMDGPFTSIEIEPVISVQVSSVAQLCLTLCNPMNRSTPGLPVHHQLLESTKLMSTESVIPSNHLILCRPLLLLPPIFPSIRVFSNESALHIRWPKFWSFSITPSNEYSGPVSFRMDWLDLLAVQGTLKSLL